MNQSEHPLFILQRRLAPLLEPETFPLAPLPRATPYEAAAAGAALAARERGIALERLTPIEPLWIGQSLRERFDPELILQPGDEILCIYDCGVVLRAGEPVMGFPYVPRYHFPFRRLEANGGEGEALVLFRPPTPVLRELPLPSGPLLLARWPGIRGWVVGDAAGISPAPPLLSWFLERVAPGEVWGGPEVYPRRALLLDETGGLWEGSWAAVRERTTREPSNDPYRDLLGLAFAIPAEAGESDHPATVHQSPPAVYPTDKQEEGGFTTSLTLLEEAPPDVLAELRRMQITAALGTIELRRRLRGALRGT